MAITGDVRDLYIRKYTDGLERELQQNGSRLLGTVTIESGLMGERTYFNRIAKSEGTVVEHVSRLQDRVYNEASYERRLVHPIPLEHSYFTDPLDLIRMSSDPRNDIITEMVDELSRKKDSIIMAALSGTAGREVGGSTSNVAFTAGNTIAVNFNGDTSLTGDTALHEGKLEEVAIRLQASYVDMSRTDVFVVSNSKQLGRLRSRVINSGWGRKDFMSKTPIMLPGLDQAIDGLYGFRFIQYEGTGVDGNLDEYVYVYPKAAIKLGFWKALYVDIYEMKSKVQSPVGISAGYTIGAVRMDEAKVYRIACDPT